MTQHLDLGGEPLRAAPTLAAGGQMPPVRYSVTSGGPDRPTAASLGLPPLRPHQDRAIEMLRDAFRAGHKRPILQAATGFGKTLVAAYMTASARGRGSRVCFGVPGITLVDQTIERFVQYGFPVGDIGVMQGSHPLWRPHAPIQIATAQTLARRERPKIDLFIPDEAHLRFGVYEEWMAECPDMKVVGLTATPWSRGLGKHFDGVVRPISLAELIDGGFLAPYRFFAPSHPDLTGVKTLAGEYHEGQLGERMNKPALVADIVTTWLARGENRATLAFCVNRAHAQAIHDQFAEAGVPVAYVDQYTPREERVEIGKSLDRGDIKVVCNIGTLIAGIDWDVRCIIFARPTKSPLLFMQAIGRGLRTADGKENLIVLDHSDTSLRLGLPIDLDEDYAGYLDSGEKGKAEPRKSEKEGKALPLPKECPSCAGLIPAATKACPCCGFEPKRPDGVEVEDGELEEITSGGKRKKDKRTIKDQLVEMGGKQLMAELKWIQGERGRKPGWTANAYRDVFGEWPKGLDDIPPKLASPLVQSYVRWKDLKFINGKRKAEGSNHGR